MQPHIVLTIDARHRIVEGIATDGHTIWVSSVLDREILACRKGCRAIAALPDGLHPFAIAWDATRQRLWVAADCPSGIPSIKACDRGALLGLDADGRIKTRIAPFIGEFHPGDVSASRGMVFVSDSQNGMVFRLTANDRAIMAVVLPDVGKSAQGTALDESGTQLLVADYSQGIGVTGIVDFKRTLLPRQDGKPLRGIDGLVRCGSIYYGIYNGEAPGLLVSIRRTNKGIEFGEPLGRLALADPTQIAFDGKRLLIVDHSGWATLQKSPSARDDGAKVLAIPLGSDCKPK